MITLLQRFCPLCFKGNRGSCGVKVSLDDPRVCRIQVECAKNSATLRCLDFSSPGNPCNSMVCQITCLVCGEAIATADENDFQKLSELDPAALMRNHAVVTKVWPRNAVHKRCCRKSETAETVKRVSKQQFYDSKETYLSLGNKQSKMPKAEAEIQASEPEEKQSTKDPAEWSKLMGMMLPAPAKKPKAPPKPRPGTAQPPAKRYKPNSPRSKGGMPEFDISQHGYVRKGSSVYYKTPDGALHECCGVDSFGPHKLASEAMNYKRK